MRNAEPTVTERTSVAPDLLCESLPPFDRVDLEDVRRAFKTATSVSLRQAWLDEEESAFSPAVVRTGWRDNVLLVFAELTDVDIFNDATELNQRTWELGDVFEVFLRPAGTESYVEFHITPNNQRLQLHFPDASSAERARKVEELVDFLVAGEAFNSLTWIEREMCRWYVYAEIPALAICGSDESMKDRQWRFSFGRYDYTRGVKAPVISSTSPFSAPDFHRQHEWGMMTCKTRR
jgi:hypothetical protein